MHCSVLLSHLKIIITEEEKSNVSNFFDAEESSSESDSDDCDWYDFPGPPYGDDFDDGTDDLV